jgi:DNA-binding MarR family transcriptional regulator
MSSAEDEPDLRIVALLRFAHEAGQRRLYEAMQEAGHTELRPAHFRLLRYPGPDGARPSDLAERVSSTKQAITPLLNDLERWGYLRRDPDPADGRARLLRLTPRGRELLRMIRDQHAEIEAEWSELLGPRRFATLRATLRDLAKAV